jgi:hypothetical protein
LVLVAFLSCVGFMASSSRDEFLILRPRERPPVAIVAEPAIWRESCQPQCSISATIPKQVAFHHTQIASPSSRRRRPVIRREGACRPQDSMKSILQHDICRKAVYHGVRHLKPQEEPKTTSRVQLRHARDQCDRLRVGKMIMKEDKNLYVATCMMHSKMNSDAPSCIDTPLGRTFDCRR